MAMGPLEVFVFPSVIVETRLEAPGTTASGDIRFPAVVGTSSEETRVSNFEVVRGSSNIADNLILEEDETAKFTGTNKNFTVNYYPIVTGNGTGKVTNDPHAVIVTVDSVPVAVNSVNGLTGEVVLQRLPPAGTEIRANYYMKRRDTYIENEDVSLQADGTNKTFKVVSSRIVKGDNGGGSATDSDIGKTVVILYNPTPGVPGDETEVTVQVLKVKVDDVEATVTNIDGSVGTFTLETAPALGSNVRVWYFTSAWQDTYDILPAAEVNRLVKVGLSQDTNDFSIGNDCVLGIDPITGSKNAIHWGHSATEEAGIYTTGSEPLEDNVEIGLSDTYVYGRVASPFVWKVDGSGNPILSTDGNGNKINLGTNKVFTLASAPVDGTGKGVTTENPSDITAYIGTSWTAAKLAGPVTVLSISGNNITLAVTPSEVLEEMVYVSQYENLLRDDTWTITNRVPGAAGVGKYTVQSNLNGWGLDVQVAAGGTIAPVYPSSPNPGFEVDPIIAQAERVKVTFDGVGGGFTVTSQVGPAFVVAGKTGSDTTYNHNKGSLGKTYIDPKTGFRVTFADTGFAPGVGTFVYYYVGDPTSATSPAKYYVTASANIVRVIPGLNLTVSSTDGVAEDNTDDTVIIYTYNKSGNEPDVGDIYYVTFDKDKVDFTTKFVTDMGQVQKLYGPIDINNRITIACDVAFKNGARAIAVKQIRKTAGGTDASVADYIEGIDAFNEPLPNGLRPSLMQPLSTDPEIHSYLKTSNAIQCSKRFRNERTSIIGFDIGTDYETVIQSVRNLATEKLTPIYPDAAVYTITDVYGNPVEYLVDGSIIACAVAGADVSPTYDIATPLTGQSVTGFTRLYRRLDNVTAAQVAQAGCTVLEEQTPVISILMYLTSDVSSVLTRNPRIVEVKHFIQQGLRRVLRRYIGIKNLPRVLPQIQDTVGSYFKSLKQSEIITNFKGIRVTPNAVDPSTVDVEAYYSPVHELDWILVTLNMVSVM
jgi:hypothetical protein